MITIKEYANQKGVTHQAVYKQLQTYKAELEGLIVTNGRTRYLTDEAVAVLDKYREVHPFVVERTEEKERIKELEDNIKILLGEKSVLESKVTALTEWKAEQAEAIAEIKYNKMLLEDKSKQLTEKEKMYQDTKKEADELHLKVQNLEAQLGKFKKGFLGFYRKIEE